MLYIENIYGCSDSISKIIERTEEITLFAPNSFTPNGDEFNNIWKIYISGIDIYSYDLSIYNRWGQITWQSYNSDKGWDGTYNGTLIPDGVYTWVLFVNKNSSSEKREYTGHINIIK